ncbi:MAG: glycosyltransferase [Oscillospiraceae bacterium]|nr:glycosyltransferase [Oscillospiraceae bacterium]
MIDENPFAGVNVAVKAFLRSQSAGNRCALWNLAPTHAQGVETEFLYDRFNDLTKLPAPFDRPDLVIFHEIYRPAFLQICRRTRQEKIPYIIIPHGGLTGRAQSVKRVKKWVANHLLFNRFVRGAEGIQYLSERERQESRPKEKAFLGTNGIDAVHPKERWNDRISRIVYIGRLDIYIKGIDLLLQAIRTAKASFAGGCRVSLYGPDEDGAHEAIRQMIREMDLDEIVAVYPPVSGTEKERILTEADCFIQTSRSEGMSMGILEALSYGLPCILTEGTSMKENLDDYDAGWICKTDPTALSALLTEVLSASGDILREKSAGAIRLIQDRFLTGQVARATIDQYQSIILAYGG